MAVALAVFGGIAPSSFPGVDESMRLSAVFFTITPSGNYPSPGGDTIDLTKLGDLIKASGPPVCVEIFSQKAGGVSGFIYGYSPAAANPSQANGKFQVFTGAAAQAALTELANGAYPAGVLGDTIIGIAYFARV